MVGNRKPKVLPKAVLAPAIGIGLVGLVVFLLDNGPARAVPSLTRQTGQPCGTCHTDFPALTPYGRRFKLLGYTAGGGQYRTTPFSNDEGADKQWVPPISVAALVDYIHTRESLPPPTSPYSPNDNVLLSNAAFFWGGAITNNIGALGHVTYEAPPPGGLERFGHSWSLDNTDIRYANEKRIAGIDVIYGVTANNNPTIQDVWNTVPTWGFPYQESGELVPMPATSTLIEGMFGRRVASVGAYTYLNNMFYLELSGYKTFDFKTQNFLGVNPFEAPGLFDGVAPYWRVAFEPHWRNHWLMLGTFGMMANVRPWVDPEFEIGSTATFAAANRYTDIGFDAQYQYQGQGFWVTLRGSYIREFQKLDASFANGASANRSNDLNSLRLQASLAYGGDHRVVFTGQYFDTWGSSDPVLYADLASGIKPDSNGWTAEVAYIPFGINTAPLWPYFNTRIGLQYTSYNKFDGTSVRAHNNDTLILYSWMAW